MTTISSLPAPTEEQKSADGRVRVCVTGAGGFIAAHLAKHLKAAAFELPLDEQLPRCFGEPGQLPKRRPCPGADPNRHPEAATHGPSIEGVGLPYQ